MVGTSPGKTLPNYKIKLPLLSFSRKAVMVEHSLADTMQYGFTLEINFSYVHSSLDCEQCEN